MTVDIIVTGSTLSNGTDSIPFTARRAGQRLSAQFGRPGIDFAVGGTITLSSTLLGGTYTGTMTVTADYQ